MLVSYCFDYYSYIIRLEIRNCKTSNFGLHFQDCFGYSRSLEIPKKFQNGFFCFCTKHHSVQFNSVSQSCLILCDPINHSTPDLPVHHQLLEYTQTHAHRVGDAIQPSHPLSSPSPPVPNPSQHQGPFQTVNSSHEMTKVLEFQLQHQSLQRTPRTDLL